jgi:hypothetical protein
MAERERPPAPGGGKVFGGLPTTRPQRRSARREHERALRAGQGALAPAEPGVPAKAEPRTAAARVKQANTTPAGPKAAAATTRPKAKSKPAAAAKSKPATGAKAQSAATRPSPKPKPGTKAPASGRPRRPRSGSQASASSRVPAAGYATPTRETPAGDGGDLIGTAIAALGEIAEIGLAAGGRALRQALGRLPRP